jgi:beta-lactamase regulating signal transducer with metallopeptidase domain
VNTSLAVFEDLADAWAGAMARASYQGGLPVIGVWAFLRLAPRVPARIQCWLWRLVFFKFVISLVWATPIDIPILTAPRVPSALKAEAVRAGPIVSSVLASGVVRGASNESRMRRPGVTLGLFSLWLLGVGASTAVAARACRATQRLTARCGGQDVNLGLSASCRDLSRRIGISRFPRLLTGGAGEGPMLIGVIRPVVIIPATMASESSAEQMRLILAHELAHARRLDLAWNWLPSIVQGLFYFHPLVWIARREWGMAQESACDALAIEVTGATAATYGRVLLHAALNRPLGHAPCLAAVGMSESYHTLKRRLNSMRNLRPLSPRRLALAALIVAVAGTFLVVPWRLGLRVAAAQEPAGDTAPPVSLSIAPPGWGGPPVSLIDIANESTVQKELKLSEKQSKRLREILDMRGQKLRALTPQSLPRPELILQAVNEVDAVAQDAIRGLMDRRQRTRMEQIKLQLEGPLAFLKPEVQSKLNLSPEQIEQIDNLVTQGRREVLKAANVPGQVDMRALNSGEISDELKNTMAQSRRSALKAGRSTMHGIGKVLRPKQLASYQAMLGEAYDVTNMGGLPMTNRKGEVDPTGARKPAAASKGGAPDDTSKARAK